MNPFDRLTDELIVKIFQHYLDHGPTPPAASIEIANLLSICKRFDNIIYNKLPSVFNHQRLQVTFITGLAYDKTRCDYDSAQCACAGLRELASTRIGKSRKLVLSSMDLRQGGCNLEALLRVSLSPIIELILMGRCDFDLFSLDRILTAQPTIKRLILTCDDGKISKESKEQLEKHSKELTCHTLAYLYLDLNSDLFEGEEEQEEELGDVLLEYMLNYLQAYEIEVRFNNSDPAHYDWVESYLTKHRNTIKHFQFHVHDIDTEMSRIFKNIPHYVQGPVDYHLRYIITSPGHPRSSET